MSWYHYFLKYCSLFPVISSIVIFCQHKTVFITCFDCYTGSSYHETPGFWEKSAALRHHSCFLLLVGKIKVTLRLRRVIQYKKSRTIPSPMLASINMKRFFTSKVTIALLIPNIKNYFWDRKKKPNKNFKVCHCSTGSIESSSFSAELEWGLTLFWIALLLNWE